jgi:hypothetical protein
MAVITISVRQEVELTDIGRNVAEVTHQPGQRDGIGRYGDAHMRDAMRRWVLPGQETEPARHADWVLHEMMREGGSLSSQPVEMRGLDVRVAVDAYSIPALLVGVEDEDVGSAHLVVTILFWFWGLLRHQWRPLPAMGRNGPACLGRVCRPS